MHNVSTLRAIDRSGGLDILGRSQLDPLSVHRIEVERPARSLGRAPCQANPRCHSVQYADE